MGVDLGFHPRDGMFAHPHPARKLFRLTDHECTIHSTAAPVRKSRSDCFDRIHFSTWHGEIASGAVRLLTGLAWSLVRWRARLWEMASRSSKPNLRTLERQQMPASKGENRWRRDRLVPAWRLWRWRGRHEDRRHAITTRNYGGCEGAGTPGISGDQSP